MHTSVFSLNDRIKPDGSNDLQVVEHLDRNLDFILGTRAPLKPRPQIDVIHRLRAYQSAARLPVDGHAETDGPTAFSIAADRARGTRRPFAGSRMSGTPAAHPSATPSPGRSRPALNVPLRAGVGQGRSNQPEDQETVRTALALTGNYAPWGALNPQPDAVGTPDPDLTPAIRRFQGRYGESQDGVIRPGGPTQTRLNHLLDGQLPKLLGPDIRNPRPFRLSPKPAVVRQVPRQPNARAVPIDSGMGFDRNPTQHRLALRHAESIMARTADATTGPTEDVAPVVTASGPDALDNDPAPIGQNKEKVLRQADANRRRHTENNRARYRGKAAETLRDRSIIARHLGLTDAAQRLQHFLDGNGETMTGDPEKERAKEFVKDAQERIVGYFEEALLEKNEQSDPRLKYFENINKMEDGDQLTWPKTPIIEDISRPETWNTIDPADNNFEHLATIYDYFETRTGLRDLMFDLDEALASGNSTTVISLTTPLTFRRQGDIIRVSGQAVGTRIDLYDFEEGGLDASLPRMAIEAGDAQTFTHATTWPLVVSGRIRVQNGVLQEPELTFAAPEPEGRQP